MTDDGGVLGNLPSSRPGRRSAKRDSGGSPAKTAGEAAAKAEQAGKAAAKPVRTPKGTGTTPKTGRKAADPIQPEPSGDAVTATVRTAAGLAVAGVRVAGAVGRELVRRLPRP
jgi:hypothetical protein